MLTSRGWWLFITAAVVATLGVAGVGYYSATVPVLGLTLLGWFLWEWGVFAAYSRGVAGRLTVCRELLQNGRVVPAAWAGVRVTVRVTVTPAAGVRVPFAVLRDRLPPGTVAADGRTDCGTPLRGRTPVVLEYALTPTAAGVLRFEGVEVRLADPAGFFRRRVFLRAAVEVLVLPPLTDDEGQRRGVKRFNSLPPPGVHRLRRPGGGSELLDLRDYRPGDPLKSIAWKPSARRDRLIIKEFESDVPVRCVLFLDASDGTRVGPPGETVVGRLAAVAAGIAQAAAASRDLVGLSVVDDAGSDYTPPARSHTHQIRLLRAIAAAAGRPPAGSVTDPVRLARHAFPLAAAVYPDLLERDVNSRPVGLYWLPVTDSLWLWAVVAVLASPALMLKREVADFVARAAAALTPAGKGWQALLVFLALPGVIAFSIWSLHGVRGLLAPRAPRVRRRKQLAATYALIDGSGPAGIERYLNDDEAFAARTNRFLAEHRTPPPVELYDAAGAYRYRSAGKVAALATALTRAVGRAHDNELYVVHADLVELADDLGTLLAAVRVARGRHHHVVVLVPWPADMPTTDVAEPPARSKAAGLTLGAVVRAAVVRQHHRRYAALRAALAAAGASVVRVGDGDSVRLVLDRLDRLRGSRVR